MVHCISYYCIDYLKYCVLLLLCVWHSVHYLYYYCVMMEIIGVDIMMWHWLYYIVIAFDTYWCIFVLMYWFIIYDVVCICCYCWLHCCVKCVNYDKYWWYDCHYLLLCVYIIYYIIDEHYWNIYYWYYDNVLCIIICVICLLYYYYYYIFVTFLMMIHCDVCWWLMIPLMMLLLLQYSIHWYWSFIVDVVCWLFHCIDVIVLLLHVLLCDCYYFLIVIVLLMKLLFVLKLWKLLTYECIYSFCSLLMMPFYSISFNWHYSWYCVFEIILMDYCWYYYAMLFIIEWLLSLLKCHWVHYWWCWWWSFIIMVLMCVVQYWLMILMILCYWWRVLVLLFNILLLWMTIRPLLRTFIYCSNLVLIKPLDIIVKHCYYYGYGFYDWACGVIWPAVDIYLLTFIVNIIMYIIYIVYYYCGLGVIQRNGAVARIGSLLLLCWHCVIVLLAFGGCVAINGIVSWMAAYCVQPFSVMVWPFLCGIVCMLFHCTDVLLLMVLYIVSIMMMYYYSINCYLFVLLLLADIVIVMLLILLLMLIWLMAIINDIIVCYCIGCIIINETYCVLLCEVLLFIIVNVLYWYCVIPLLCIVSSVCSSDMYSLIIIDCAFDVHLVNWVLVLYYIDVCIVIHSWYLLLCNYCWYIIVIVTY